MERTNYRVQDVPSEAELERFIRHWIITRAWSIHLTPSVHTTKQIKGLFLSLSSHFLVAVSHSNFYWVYCTKICFRVLPCVLHVPPISPLSIIHCNNSR